MFFVALTVNTARSGRVRVKPLLVDSLAASFAHAICAQNDAPERRIDSAQFLNLTRDLGEVHVDEEVGECFVLGIVDLAGDLEILLLIATQERFVKRHTQGALTC